MSPPPRVPPHPGNPPRAPEIPLGERRAVREAVDRVLESARVVRIRHEQALATEVGIARFEGAAATDFRLAVVGELRRLRELVVTLEADGDALDASIAEGRRRLDAHEAAVRAHDRAVARYQAARQDYDRWLAARDRAPCPPWSPSRTPGENVRTAVRGECSSYGRGVRR